MAGWATIGALPLRCICSSLLHALTVTISELECVAQFCCWILFFMVPNQILLQNFWSDISGLECGVQLSCWILHVLVPNENILRKLCVWYIWTGGGFWMDHQDTYWPSIDGTHLPTSRPNGNNCITKYSYNQISFTLCVLKKGVQQAWINLPEELYLCQFFRVQSVCRKYESTAKKTLSEEENNCCNTCTHCKGKV